MKKLDFYFKPKDASSTKSFDTKTSWCIWFSTRVIDAEPYPFMILFFLFLADSTYIKIGGIATRFKSELSMGRLMIGCKCVLPCVWLFRFIKHFSITLLYYLCKIIHILLFITANIWLQHNPAYSGRHLDSNEILVETNNTQIGCQRILTPLASM